MTPTTETGSTQLQAELGELLRKSDRLDEEMRAANGALDAARSELLADAGKRQIDSTTVAQSRVMALEGIARALAAQMEAKGRELAAAEASEARQGQLDLLAEIAAAAAKDLREYELLREASAADLRKLADRLLDKFTALSEHRQKFIARAHGLADLTYASAGTGGYGRASAEERQEAREFTNALEDAGVDLTAVAIPFDGSSSLIDRAYLLPSVEPFENVIAVMIQIVYEERSTKSSPRRPR